MYNEFSERIVSLRKKRGWTQEMVAEKCGVSRQAVAKWENNQCIPDVFRIVELADLFQVEITDILPKTQKGSYLKYTLDAVSTVFQNMIVVNLTKGTFRYVINNKWPVTAAENGLDYDELFTELVQSIPDMSHRTGFTNLFSRTKMISAYERGETNLQQNYVVLFGEEQEHWVCTSAYFVPERQNGDIIVVGYSRIIDSEIEVEREKQRYKDMTYSLAADYTAVLQIDIDSGKIVYIYNQEKVVVGPMSMLTIGSDWFEFKNNELYKSFIHPDCYESFLKKSNKETVLQEVEKTDTYYVDYKCIIDGVTYQYQTKYSKSLDFDNDHLLVVGVHRLNCKHLYC